MNFADHFNQALRRYENVYRLPSMANSIVLMEKTKVEVENKLKDVDMGEPNPELVRLTIRKFFDWAKNPAISFNWLEVALICRGLLIEIPGFGSLMKSESAVTLLLTKFDKQYKSQILSPYSWQGLLNAYLNCSTRDNDIEIRNNRDELRKFLSASLDEVFNGSSFKPRWLEAISKHKIVLAENATRILAEEALQGRMDRVECLACEVKIPPTSWFWPELMMSQIEVMTAYPEERFKQAINLVLPLLQQREECLNDGLAQILNRYAKCNGKETHHDLKSIAVKRWKNPSLKKQRDWERVSQDAKEMVQKWLVREDIALFELFGDHRRYEFWLQFLDQIEYTFIWLGKEAQESFPHILENRRDRCALLIHPGRPDNNVILMKIRDMFIIESGAKAGGKCWAYRADKILPLLEKRSLNYDIFRDTYKNIFTHGYGTLDGLVHQVSGWEGKFHGALERLGIKPDALDLEMLLSRYQLRVEKTPSGTLWVRHGYHDGVIADFLRTHGFSFRSSSEGFYLNSRLSTRY